MIPLHAYDTIIFDLDGTLLDTWPSLLRAVHHVTAPGARLDPAALRHMLSQGIDAMFALAARQSTQGGAQARQAQADMARHYGAHTLLDAQPYPGTSRLLHALADAGYRLALCTNRDRASTLALLARQDWLPRFALVHCLDDGLPPKPDPAAPTALLARLACAPAQALFVGDSHVDAQCADRAGISFAAHLGGYHAVPEDLDPAVFRYDDAHDLTQWLARQPAAAMETEHE
ncbi:Phosphoglycolate phosphatase [plant metagenome]|uniref:Phosphoglycolate phosphatase n=1 Tax=plant metagenome TaxID=1297885 RepID=A0A484PL18_9ZZZZ